MARCKVLGCMSIMLLRHPWHSMSAISTAVLMASSVLLACSWLGWVLNRPRTSVIPPCEVICAREVLIASTGPCSSIPVSHSHTAETQRPLVRCTARMPPSYPHLSFPSSPRCERPPLLWRGTGPTAPPQTLGSSFQSCPCPVPAAAGGMRLKMEHGVATYVRAPDLGHVGPRAFEVVV